MVKNADDLRGLLIQLDRRFDQADDGTFLVSVGAGQAPVALLIAHPVLVAQVGVGPAPKGDTELAAKVFRQLLEHNAIDLLHASYALEGDDIVLSAALELESLDMNELEAVLADIGMAMSSHVSGLKAMIEQKV
ncbi:MAG: hypothetical protein KF718_27495 [Polyangiaceae bacterium]|nr:hypothetical protein [Polyangiaceae bacterium]